ATGRSACNGPCAAYWPPLVSNGRPVALPGVDRSLIGTTRRSEGSEQVTFAGHPLSLFVQARKPRRHQRRGIAGFRRRLGRAEAIGREDRSRRVTPRGGRSAMRVPPRRRPAVRGRPPPRPPAPRTAAGTARRAATS